MDTLSGGHYRMAVLGLSTAAEWPRTWAKQQVLRKALHDRCEATLSTLIELYENSFMEASKELTPAFDGSCRRLFWNLKLHMHLEERWVTRRASSA